MASKKIKLSDDDIALFRNTVKKIKPLKHGKAEPFHAQPKAIPKQTLRDEALVRQDMLSDAYDPADIEIGDELFYARPGIQRNLLRKLRRGQFSTNAELDLHGMIVPEAREALMEFLHDCQARGARCIRIVHGKGHGSRNKQPVLKTKLNNWLRQIDDVLAFCSARPVDGGTGAVYVLLKRG